MLLLEIKCQNQQLAFVHIWKLTSIVCIIHTVACNDNNFTTFLYLIAFLYIARARLQTHSVRCHFRVPNEGRRFSLVTCPCLVFCSLDTWPAYTRPYNEPDLRVLGEWTMWSQDQSWNVIVLWSIWYDYTTPETLETLLSWPYTSPDLHR